MATLLDIEIIDTESALDEKWKVYTRYLIRVTTGGGVLEVGRRYSDFAELNKRIIKLPLGKIDKKDLPRLTTKKLFGRNGPKLIQKRKRKLEVYLKRLLELSKESFQLYVQLVAFLRDDALHPDNSVALEYLEASAPRVQSAPGAPLNLTTKSSRQLKQPKSGPNRPASQSVGSPIDREPFSLASSSSSGHRRTAVSMDSDSKSESADSPAAKTPTGATKSRRARASLTPPAEIKKDGYVKLAWEEDAEAKATATEPANEESLAKARRSSVSTRRCAMCGKPIVDDASGEAQLFCSTVCKNYHAATSGKGFVPMVRADGSVRLQSVQAEAPKPKEPKSKRRMSFLRRKSTVEKPEPKPMPEAAAPEKSSRTLALEKRRAHAQSFFDAHKTRDRATPMLQKLRQRTLVSSSSTRMSAESPTLAPADGAAAPQKRSSRASVYLPDMSEAFTGIRKSGFLWKRGGWRGGRKNWKQRLFVLQDNCLYYYKKSCSVLLGVVALSNRIMGDTIDDMNNSDDMDAQVTILPSDHEVRVGLPSSRYPAFIFEVKTVDRALYLCAETRQLLYEWVAQIRKSIREYGEKQAQLVLGPELSELSPASPQQPGTPSQLGQLDLIREESDTMHEGSGGSSRGRTQDREEAIARASITGAGSTPRGSQTVTGETFKDAIETGGSGRDDALTRSRTSVTGGSGSNPSGSYGMKGQHDANMQFWNWEIKEEEVEVSERLGGGNYGEVFRGRLWGSDVAVKLLLADELTDEVLTALKDEVSILSSLRHPNVVLYMGACTTPPNVFIVTEWCERGSLHDYIYDLRRPLSASMRLAMALEAARGMSYLHSRRHRIIHRDLKSHNLLLTKNFTVKVADFGLTVARGHNKKMLEGSSSKRALDDEGGTGSGSYYGIQGTPQWMAPEVLEGQRYNGKVDVYSFGVVLCEIFSRTLPFSDRYKRFDFVDAVLEEGAMPTIPRWCDVLAAVESRDDEYDFEGPGSPSIPEANEEDAEEEASTEEQEEETQYDIKRKPDFGGGISLECRKWIQRQLQREARFTAYMLRRAVFSGASDQRMEVVYKSLQPDDNSDGNGEGKEEERKGDGTAKKDGPRVLSARWWSFLGPHVPGSMLEWTTELGECSGVLRLIIQTCLSRDPSARPNFEELVDLLHAVYQQPNHDIFRQLDVPRLREALCYGAPNEQLLAVREIMQLTIRAIAAGGQAEEMEAGLAADGTEAEEPVASDPEDSALLPVLKSTLPVRSGWSLPHLPFGQTTSSEDTVSTVSLKVLLQSSADLLGAIAARLRSNDILFRIWLGLTATPPSQGTDFLSLPLGFSLIEEEGNDGLGCTPLDAWSTLADAAGKWQSCKQAAAPRRVTTGLAAKRKLREGKALAAEEASTMSALCDVSAACIQSVNCLIQAHTLARTSTAPSKADSILRIRRDLLNLFGPHCCRLIPSLLHFLLASPISSSEIRTDSDGSPSDAAMSGDVSLSQAAEASRLPIATRVYKQIISILRLLSQLDPFMAQLIEQESELLLAAYDKVGMDATTRGALSRRLKKLETARSSP